MKRPAGAETNLCFKNCLPETLRSAQVLNPQIVHEFLPHEVVCVLWFAVTGADKFKKYTHFYKPIFFLIFNLEINRHNDANRLVILGKPKSIRYEFGDSRVVEVFVARQPIFDKKQNLFAYELLFRSGLENFYDPSQDGDHATKKLLSNSFLVIGMDTLTRGKRGFINFTKDLLTSGAASVLPKDLITIEVLENVEVDDSVIAACNQLKDSGYVIALDDFVLTDRFKPLVEIADIIKVDFIQTQGDERQKVIERVNNKNIKFLAEKVETAEEFDQARSYGYSYFQGYFFSKPVVVKGRDIPGNKINLLNILHEVNKPDIELNKIDNIIKHDVALTYKLLRFINSAYFRFSVNVESIKHALVLLGIKEIKKWVSLIALSGMASDKPQELVSVSLFRAKFSESICPKIGYRQRSSDFFLMGLFSVIDALVDKPMEELLSDLPISEEIKHALMGRENVFRDVYSLIIAYEKGDWEQTTIYSQKLSLPEEELPDMYLDSVKWANVTI